jgi:hypothetical protein
VAAAAHIVAPLESCTLWDAEVGKLLAAAPDLPPAARAALRSVLFALAGDESLDAATKADVERLLASARPIASATRNQGRSHLRALAHAVIQVH